MFSARVLNRIVGISSNLSLAKREAGHSKWANIRHIKAAKDGEKAALITRKLRDIRAALSATNWVTDVGKNPLLVKAIDGALRANVPKDTVDNFMKKAEKSKETPLEYRLRGPSDSIFIVTFSCSPITVSELRGAVKRILLKSNGVLSITPGFQQAFEKKGVILAKLIEKKASMDDAEEAAILAGAEEVRPEDSEDNIFRFLSDAQDFYRVTKELKELSWEIIEASIEDLPTYLVDVSEEDKEELAKAIEKFQELPEFVKMADNVA